MLRKLLISLSIVAVGSSGLFAFRLLTQAEAITALFGEGVKVTTTTKELTDATRKKLETRLGGSLFHYSKATLAGELSQDKVDFFTVSKNGATIGVALIDVEPGKWGPVEFMISIDPKGAVSKVVVMSFEEKRGRPIARSTYLSQYIGKTVKSKLIVGEDVTGVSGATVSSESATFAVKKALVLYDELYRE